ncbi:hypothetical protein E4U53_005620 [Claviceps sorghi]|nr:hypothetical protein E4U53_005620 [Claviceps sorghi]
MYLCGFTLFLSLILNRMYHLMLDNMHLESRVKAFESNQSYKEGKSSQVAELQKKLAQKETDLQTLKKQSEQLNKSYNDLADQVATQDGGDKDAKKTK